MQIDECYLEMANEEKGKHCVLICKTMYGFFFVRAKKNFLLGFRFSRCARSRFLHIIQHNTV